MSRTREQHTEIAPVHAHVKHGDCRGARAPPNAALNAESQQPTAVRLSRSSRIQKRGVGTSLFDAIMMNISPDRWRRLEADMETMYNASCEVARISFRWGYVPLIIWYGAGETEDGLFNAIFPPA